MSYITIKTGFMNGIASIYKLAVLCIQVLVKQGGKSSSNKMFIFYCGRYFTDYLFFHSSSLLTHCQEYFIRSVSQEMPLETWCSVFTQQKESQCYLCSLSQHFSLWHHAFTVPYRVTATWELIKERKYKDPLECKLDQPPRPALTAGWPETGTRGGNSSSGMRRKALRRKLWWKDSTGHSCPCCCDNDCSLINRWSPWKPFLLYKI